MANPTQTLDGISVVLFGIVLAWLLRHWVKEMLFYKRNGWDFTQPSGQKMFPGSDRLPQPSNEIRVLVGFPIMISIFAIVVFGSALLKWT